MPFTYEYARPAVTCDAIIFTMRADDLAVLLIKRGEDPFKGAWAFPGGHLEPNESLEKCCVRELQEETGITNAPFEQLGAFGDPGRDPRGHYVTVAYYTYIAAESVRMKAGDDASEVAWIPLRQLDFEKDDAKKTKVEPAPKRGRGKKEQPLHKLAFDHAKILRLALERLRERLMSPAKPSRFHMVPPHFTLPELRRVYEVIFGRAIDPRKFRTHMVARDLVEPIAAPQKKKGSAKKKSSAGMLFRYKHVPQRRTVDD